MPLSEHEQRLLDQMERALYAEDPKFATSMRHPSATAADRRRVALGVVAFLAGLGLLVAGVATAVVPIGVGGFLAMLGGIWLATAGNTASTQGTAQPLPVRPTKPGGSTRPSRPRKNRRSNSLTERMEERWRRRRETGDF
ncbi:MAG: DUF3040 domain-containing protein [Candidatus Nanopelagicales bacterium]